MPSSCKTPCRRASLLSFPIPRDQQAPKHMPSAALQLYHVTHTTCNTGSPHRRREMTPEGMWARTSIYSCAGCQAGPSFFISQVHTAELSASRTHPPRQGLSMHVCFWSWGFLLPSTLTQQSVSDNFPMTLHEGKGWAIPFTHLGALWVFSFIPGTFPPLNTHAGDKAAQLCAEILKHGTSCLFAGQAHDACDTQQKHREDQAGR